MALYSFDFISEKAQTHGTDLAYVDESHEVTFREFDFYTKKIATYLRDKGIKPGDLVATILPPYLDWHFTFALQRLGIATMSKNNFAPFSEEAFPDFLITIKTHPRFPQEKTILVDANQLSAINQCSDEIELNGFANSSDLARLFSTSGTTGDVKYISASAEGLAHIAQRTSSYDLAGLDDVLSLYLFGSGQTYGLALKNAVNGKAYYSCGLTDYRLAKLVSKYPIRTLIGSPAQVSAFLDVQNQTGTEFPKLSTIIMGGSPPGSDIVERIARQLDCRVFNAYGSTEVGNISIQEITHGLGIERYAGNLIHEDVVLQVVDEADQQVSGSATGIIRYKRSGMIDSYFGNELASKANFRDGFFYPGDLGHLDSEGRLVLDGRLQEVINLGGVKLNPETIDAIVRAQLGVVDCAAFAQMSPTGVEQLALALVVDGDFSKELFERTMEKKSPHPISSVVLVEKIERNPNGKVMRSHLSQIFKAPNPQ